MVTKLCPQCKQTEIIDHQYIYVCDSCQSYNHEMYLYTKYDDDYDYGGEG